MKKRFWSEELDYDLRASRTKDEMLVLRLMRPQTVHTITERQHISSCLQLLENNPFSKAVGKDSVQGQLDAVILSK